MKVNCGFENMIRKRDIDKRTQHTERQPFEKKRKLQTQKNRQAVSSPSEESMEKKKLQIIDKILIPLNEQQQSFVFHIFKCFKQKNTPFYFFLSGSAGAGKSYTLKAIAELITSLFDAPQGLLTVLIMSPSKETASLIGGTELHESLAIPLSLSSLELPKLSAHTAEFLYSKLKAVKLIILDEIQSVGKDLISHVNTRLKEIFNVASDFACLPVILAGDLRQQSLDVDSAVFQHTQIWQRFQFYELQSSFRQKTDPDFARILSNFRDGKLSEMDLEMLNSRDFEGQEKCIPSFSTFLFCSDGTTDCFNKVILSELPGDGVTFTALDVISGPGNKDDIAELQKYYYYKPLSDVGGLPRELLLRVSAKYMLTHDIDASDGLVAGITGILRSFGPSWHEHKNFLQVSLLYLEFDSPIVGAKIRLQHFGGRTKYDGKVKGSWKRRNWVPITRIDATLPHGLMYNLTLTRSQFPLIPATAIPLRHLRGKAFDTVCISLKEKEMTPNLLYLALSRVSSLKDLYFVGTMTEKHALLDNVLSEELSRLRNKAALQLELLRPNQGGDISVYFHNIEDLRTNFSQTLDFNLVNLLKMKCMTYDPSIKEHDILIFAGELLAEDNVAYLVDRCNGLGFHLIPGMSPKKSLIILSKMPLCVLWSTNQCDKKLRVQTSITALKLGNLIIVAAYASNKFPKRRLKRIFEQFVEPVTKHYNVIMVCNLHFSKEMFTNFSNFQPAVQTKKPTWKYSPSAIFTNFKEYNAHIDVSLFTLHQPVYIQASKNLKEFSGETTKFVLNSENLNQYPTYLIQSLRLDNLAIVQGEKSKQLQANTPESNENSNEKTRELIKPHNAQTFSEIDKSYSFASSADFKKSRRKSHHIVRKDFASNLRKINRMLKKDLDREEAEMIEESEGVIEEIDEGSDKVEESEGNIEKINKGSEERSYEKEAQSGKEEKPSDAAGLPIEATEGKLIPEAEILNDNKLQCKEGENPTDGGHVIDGGD